MYIFQKGFNFAQDGPGNRLVYHLQRCNMQCPWCSNPEGMGENPKAKNYSVDELFDECYRSRMMFFKGGGVTFTGGEATLQADELLELLKRLHSAGINTAIETNGTSARLVDLLPYIDYVMMDFKHYDSEKLLEYTKVPIKNIKSNYEYMCKSGRQAHIRIPLIREFNAREPEKDAEGFARYFAELDTSNVVFEFLPYHEYGKDKWTEAYKIKDGFVDKATVEIFKKVFYNHGLKLIST